MAGYVLSSAAESDLQDIWDYIAQDNLNAADRVLVKLRSAMRKLSEMPGIGHERPDLEDPTLRVWSVYSYLIIYNNEADPIRVVRVIHGARDIPHLM